MRIPCSFCGNQTPRVTLHRVGHRLICRSCFTARKKATFGPEGPAPLLESEELQSLRRLDRRLTTAWLVAKALFYCLLFWWAHATPVGAAVLQGCISADILTWILFSLLEWEYRGLQVTIGGMFEVVLVMIYLGRDSLFDMSAVPEEMAMTMLSFLACGSVKGFFWGAEHMLQVTGVKE